MKVEKEQIKKLSLLISSLERMTCLITLTPLPGFDVFDIKNAKTVKEFFVEWKKK